ncbi:MAG: hypothetical protein HYV54_01970 [Parcubacteria group bacterium]|nr:hypothetical protein [Parcubacteria group bacterium]
MARKPREATPKQKEILIRLGILSPEKAEDLFLTEASHLLRIHLAASELEKVRNAAKSLNVGDDVDYHGIVCRIVRIHELRPKGAFCNMNNVTIQPPESRKKTVQANSLKKVGA